MSDTTPTLDTGTPAVDDATPPAPTAPRPSRARRLAVVCLAALTVISLLASTLAFWSHRLLLDTDAWVATVAPLAEDEAVTDLVAARLTEQLVEVTDPEAKLAAALPDQASLLAGPLTAAATTFVESSVASVLASDQFATFWAEANRYAHEKAVVVLRGDTDGPIAIDDGVVSLNLLPIVAAALTKVNERAPDLLTDGRPVPTIAFDTPPDEARAELSTALGRDLPESFGVIQVFRSDQLAAAQQAVRLFDRVTWALPVLTLLLLAATLALADRRRPVLIGFGLGTIAAMAFATAVVRAGRNFVLDLIGNPEGRAAAASTIATLVANLRVLTQLVVAAAVVLTVVALVTGDSRVAVGLRRQAAGMRPSAGDETNADATPVSAFVRDNLVVLQFAGATAAVMWLVLADLTFVGLALALLLLAAYEVVLLALAGSLQASNGDPDAASVG